MMYKDKSWLTVKEVASYLSLSSEMVYKLVRQGEIPAVHLGTNWRINHVELERWLALKQGGPREILLSPLHTQVIKDFLTKLRSHYGDFFLDLYIFGSVARGESNGESDVDTLVVLKNLGDRWKEMKEIEKIAYAVTFGKGVEVVISVTVASASEFSTRQDPLFKRIREEGRRAA